VVDLYPYKEQLLLPRVWQTFCVTKSISSKTSIKYPPCLLSIVW